MKVLGGVVFSFLLAGAIGVALSGYDFAQAGQGPGCGRSRYDVSTEITVQGTVQDVKEVAGPGRSTGIHLAVRTKDSVVEVHAGPSWYLKQQKYEFAKGDQIEVTGSKVKFQDSDVILARQIKKGGRTWTLRDAQGIPLWSGPKRGQ